MRTAIACGIDYGTSNSSASIAYDDGTVELVPVGKGSMPFSLPSFTYLHRDGNRVSGDEAVQEYLVTGANRTNCEGCDFKNTSLKGKWIHCEQYAPGSSCNDSRLMYALKSELANDLFVRTHSWGRHFYPSGLLSITFRHLKREVDRKAGTPVRRVVLGKPFGFVGAEVGNFEKLQQLAIDRLVEGAEQAGFTEIETAHEPEAAGQVERPPIGNTLVVDFGGGTFDVAVLRRESQSAGVIATALQGSPIGGDDFDALIFDHFVGSQLGVSPRQLFQHWSELRTMAGVRSLLSDRRFGHELGKLRMTGVDTSRVEAIVFGGHAYGFYKAIEQAKLDLSESDSATIAFERAGLSIFATIKREQFEAVIKDSLARIENAIARALVEAHIEGVDIDAVMVTGGSSRIPAFLRMLNLTAPNAYFLPIPPFTAVAEGLGMRAVSLWA